MIIAFTGTREGMSERQKIGFRDLVSSIEGHPPTIFLHGGCYGADMEALAIVLTHGNFIIQCFPGDEHQERNNKAYNQVMNPVQPYLLRNDIMVSRCDLLIAAPSTTKEQPKGGTWFTIKKARERGKPCVILDR